MTERFAVSLTNNYAIYERYDLSACDLLIHAQDFVRYIIKQYGLDKYGYNYMSVYSRIKEVINYMRACKITPLFVVDGTLDSHENIVGIRHNIICEFLSSSGVSFVVSRSSAVCTCLALAEQYFLPMLISNPKFYVNLYSRDSSSRHIFIPIECLQNLNSVSSKLQAKKISFFEFSFPRRYLYLGCLLMELIDLPTTTNMDLEVGLILKWLQVNKDEPLVILQQIMQAVLQSDDPCLVTQMLVDYLVSLTPDFEEAFSVSSQLGLKTTKSPADLDFYDSVPGSPQYFFNLAIHIIEGIPCHHSKIKFNGPGLDKLFHQGKIDSSLLSPAKSNLHPMCIFQRLQQAVISKRIYINNFWSYIVDYFHFSISYLLEERIAAIVLSCLLWHSHSSCSNHTAELCPLVLSTVFCALTNTFCEGSSEMFSTMIDSIKSEKLGLNDAEETYLKQAEEILQSYSEFLSFSSIVNGSEGSSKISLFKQVSFEPAFRVFPCLRLSVLLAAKLHFSEPTNRLNELLGFYLLHSSKFKAPDMSSAFQQFMELIKITNIHWDESQFTPSTSSKNLLTEVSNIPISIPPEEKHSHIYNSNSLFDSKISQSNHCDFTSTAWTRSPMNRQVPEYVPVSDSIGKSSSRNKASSAAAPPRQPDYDRPKTPPPASAFMKKTKAKSKYASLLAQRFGDKI